MRHPRPKLKDIIANASLFRMLTPEQHAFITARTSTIRVGSHTTIVHQGDPGEGVYWLVYGQVSIAVHGKQGSAKLLALLGDGTCFGLGEMVLDQPHQACVESTAPSMLLHIEREAILEVAGENPAFAREVMTCLGRQFYGLVRDIGNYSLSAHQRLADYLVRHGEPVPDYEMELVANKGIIAARLSLTPETLSRVFRDFISDGMISVTGRRITVHDWPRVNAVLA